MSLFLALLLVTGLPWAEMNVTVTGRQQALNCHVCERENDFGCVNPKSCPADTQFCSTAAVKVFPRFFYVSKQCSRYCPVISSSSAAADKSFILEKPTPFIYVRCCSGQLCNSESLNISDFSEFREAGRAREVQSGRAGPVLVLVLSSASLGLGPS